MTHRTIFADFHNADAQGRLRLNCVGTVRTLMDAGIELRDGLRLCLSDDELITDGEVHFSEEERIWVAVIDWDAIRQTDEIPSKS